MKMKKLNKSRKTGQEFSKMYSLSVWLPFQKKFMKLRSAKEVSTYSVFTFAVLYNLHFVISKLMEKYTVSCLTSDRLRTRGLQNGIKAFVEI